MCGDERMARELETVVSLGHAGRRDDVHSWLEIRLRSRRAGLHLVNLMRGRRRLEREQSVALWGGLHPTHRMAEVRELSVSHVDPAEAQGGALWRWLATESSEER